MEPNIDVEAFKRFERAGWEQSVEGYDRLFAPLTMQMIEPLVTALQPRPRERFLDVATGPGYLAARAEALGCSVVAVDVSDAMVIRARER